MKKIKKNTGAVLLSTSNGRLFGTPLGKFLVHDGAHNQIDFLIYTV
jgi:hypothetical protein